MSPDSPDSSAPTQDELDLLHYESRIERPVRMKLSEFERNERLRHVIFSGQFSVPMLEELAGTADKIRILSKDSRGAGFSHSTCSP